jgi:hypothetical protein
MKHGVNNARDLAKKIAVSFFEAGHGENLEQMLELSGSTIADLIYESEKELLRTAHARYVEAVKRCAD